MNAVRFLKETPKGQATLQEVKDVVGDPLKTARMMKHPDFRSLTERFAIPYREHYPDAPVSEWQAKNKQEKSLQMVRLKDKSIEIHEIFKKTTPDAADLDAGSVAFLDDRNRRTETSLLRQVYQLIESKRAEGITQTEIQNYFGLTKLAARTLLRNIERLNVVHKFMVDVGRQKMARFVLHKWKNAQKTVALVENIAEEVVQVIPTAEESIIYEGINLDSVPSTVTFSKIYDNFKVKTTESIRNMLENNTVSNKMVDRCNQILRMVALKKVIHSVELYKVMIETEKQQGYKESIDRRSMKRLLGRLAADDYVKFFTLKVKI